MPGGWWCCCGCWEFEDDFDDPDTTDFVLWYELSGDWGIDDQHLEEPYSP